MSEQGWKEFLAADGVDDWVVLHGGATAVFQNCSATAMMTLGFSALRSAAASSRIRSSVVLVNSSIPSVRKRMKTKAGAAIRITL